MMQSFHWLQLALLLYLTSLGDVEAQFPIDCTEPLALQSRTCCPFWNGSPCGVDADRGFCARHWLNLSPFDYRVNWPGAFYENVCACKPNYDGYDCGQCLPGWKGPTCSEPHFVNRKEITDMTDSERQNFFSNLDTAKHTTSNRYKILTSNDTTVFGNFKFHSATVYDLYVWLHYYASKQYADTTDDAAHRGPAFPFWHRVFLLFIEREIRLLTGNQDFYIPYWDWTRTNHCNICTNEFFGAVGPDGHIDKDSRFSKWKTACVVDEGLRMICSHPDDPSPAPLSRRPGMDPTANTLPIYADVQDMLRTNNYDTPPFNKASRNSFRSKIEGFEIPHDARHLQSSMHNLVHDYFNGTMSHLPTAANDPIFMVHHSFVDKLLAEWLTNHRHVNYPESEEIHPAQRKDAYMAPFFPLRTNGWYWDKDITTLGYNYVDHSIPHPGRSYILHKKAYEGTWTLSSSDV